MLHQEHVELTNWNARYNQIITILMKNDLKKAKRYQELIYVLTRIHNWIAVEKETCETFLRKEKMQLNESDI